MPDFIDRLQLSHRKMGTVLTILGTAGAYWGFYSPISGILSHQPSIRLSYAAMFLSIAGIGIGITMIAMGEKHIEVFGHYSKPNLKGRIYALVFLAIAYVASGRLETFAKSRGYQQVRVNLI